MKQREVLLFAIASDLAGCDRLAIDIPQNASVNDVMLAIGVACPALSDWLPCCRLAVGQSFAAPGDSVSDDAEIALIPPVSGG